MAKKCPPRVLTEKFRVSLAYSGGTLTSVKIPLPQENFIEQTEPDQETDKVVDVLAKVVAYVSIGSAHPVFPLSTRAAPSTFVLVLKSSTKALVNSGDREMFPYKIDWRLWERGIVPVLDDETFKAQNALNRVKISQGRFGEYVYKVRQGLTASFKQAGFLPDDS